MDSQKKLSKSSPLDWGSLGKLNHTMQHLACVYRGKLTVVDTRELHRGFPLKTLSGNTWGTSNIFVWSLRPLKSPKRFLPPKCFTIKIAKKQFINCVSVCLKLWAQVECVTQIVHLMENFHFIKQLFFPRQGLWKTKAGGTGDWRGSLSNTGLLK